MGVGAGKWYWEAKYHDHSGDTNTVYVGVAPANDPWIPELDKVDITSAICRNWWVNGLVFT